MSDKLALWMEEQSARESEVQSQHSSHVESALQSFFSELSLQIESSTQALSSRFAALDSAIEGSVHALADQLPLQVEAQTLSAQNALESAVQVQHSLQIESSVQAFVETRLESSSSSSSAEEGEESVAESGGGSEPESKLAARPACPDLASSAASQENGAANKMCASRRRALQLSAEAPVCVNSLRAELIAAFARHARMPRRRKRRGR